MTRFEGSASTILVIDDTNTNLKIAVEHLQAYDYVVLTARTGEEVPLVPSIWQIEADTWNALSTVHRVSVLRPGSC